MAKQSTPTMGGLFIVGGLAAAAVAVFGDWSNPYLPIVLGAGGWRWPCWEPGDDLVKLAQRRPWHCGADEIGWRKPRSRLAAAWLVYRVAPVGRVAIYRWRCRLGWHVRAWVGCSFRWRRS